MPGSSKDQTPASEVRICDDVPNSANARGEAVDHFIPVLDFSDLQRRPVAAKSGDDQRYSSEEAKKLMAGLLHEAFRNVGFVYIKNHGLSEDTIREAFEKSRNFFTVLSDSDKGKISRDAEQVNGFSAVGREILDTTGMKQEVRESFDIINMDDEEGFWAKAKVPDEFKSSMNDIQRELKGLAELLLRLLAIGIGIPEAQLLSWHSAMLGTAASASNGSINGCKRPSTGTCLRTLYYPPIQQAEHATKCDLNTDGAGESSKDDIIRCGEHSDYGTITLLIQDDQGGLEVLSRRGEWIPAKPIEGTVLVNIGDLVEMWTGGDLIATKHRVLVPQAAADTVAARQSIVLFVHPNDDILVEPICASKANDGRPHQQQKYRPVNAGEYLKQRLRDTYA